MSERLNNLIRHFFRAYRKGPIPLGHSLIRRSFNSVLGQEQEICLRSGLRLRLDMSKGNQNGIFWEDGDAEIALHWAIRELLPLGGQFVDCGANCGLMGLLARQYRLAGVIFIEPHPRLAKTIEMNIRLNGFNSSCELVEAAVSDISDEVTFYENPTADGAHSLHADWGGAKRNLGKVRCVTLQEIVAARQISTIHFLKIDTEGNDYAVIKGLGECLEPGFVKVIYIEMSRDKEAACDLLRSRGYVGFVKAGKRRREVARLQHRYERGGRPAFFTPIKEDTAIYGEVLWCGKNSCADSFLTELATMAARRGASLHAGPANRKLSLRNLIP